MLVIIMVRFLLVSLDIEGSKWEHMSDSRLCLGIQQHHQHQGFQFYPGIHNGNHGYCRKGDNML